MKRRSRSLFKALGLSVVALGSLVALLIFADPSQVLEKLGWGVTPALWFLTLAYGIYRNVSRCRQGQ